MIINFLDLDVYKFRVGDSTHEKIISKSDSTFESFAGDTLRIEQLPGAGEFSPAKAVLFALVSFLTTAVRALIIPTKTLYGKRSPLFLNCSLRIKKEYGETSVYYVKSETEQGMMNFSKPHFVFEKEFEQEDISYFADEPTIEANRKKLFIDINSAYILLYILVALFAAFGVVEKNFTVLFICLLSLSVFILCHGIAYFRAKKHFGRYCRNLHALEKSYNERKE